jgi:aldehyde dehydrogenase (NAD+)
MPILSYDSIEEVITFIQSHPKPLALYLFGRSREGIDEVLGRTTSGSACINDLIVQIENLNVPFGGIGMSGTGNYHGLFGFKTFSHERNYMRMGKPNLVTRLYPPYGNRAQALMKGLLERVAGMAKK